MSDHKTHYDVLEVSPDSEPEVIEAAYRALIKKYHPDKSQGASHQNTAARLNEAYRVLRDPKARAQYNDQLQKGASPLLRKVPPAAADRGANPMSGDGRILLFIFAGVVALIIWAGSQSSPPAIGSTENVSMDASQNLTPPAPEPVSPPSIDEPASKKGARYVRIAVDAEGLPGAQIYSINCYASLQRNFSWPKADQCAVFDAVTTIAIQHDPTLSGSESTYFTDDKNKGRFDEAVHSQATSADSSAHHYSLLQAAAVLDWRPHEPEPSFVEATANAGDHGAVDASGTSGAIVQSSTSNLRAAAKGEVGRPDSAE